MASTRDSAFHRDDAAFADLNDDKILNRDACVTHVTTHTVTLKNVLRSTGTTRTRHTKLIFVTVGGWRATKAVTLYNTSKTATL